MSKKDLSRPDHFANPQHQSDDEDGPEDNQAGWSSGPIIEFRAERNINMNGEQNVGNVTGSSLPLTSKFVVKADDNYNGGERQDVGNIVFRNINPKKMSHNKLSFTDIGSHSRNLKPHQRDDTSKITSRYQVLETDASSSESNYALRNHSPSTDPPAAQDPGQGESSRRVVSQEIKDNTSSKGVQELGNIKLDKTSAIAFLDSGGEVSQTIVGNNNRGKAQRIGNIDTNKDNADHDAR